MKIIYNKKLAEQKKKEVEAEYFKKAKTLHRLKRFKGFVSLMLFALFIGSFPLMKTLSVNKNLSDFTFLVIFLLIASSFLFSIALFASMCNTDDSSYHYPNIDYPADVQFLILSRKYDIRNIDIKRYFSTTRMVVTGIDKNKQEKKEFIEIPNQISKYDCTESVVDLCEGTYYIPLAKIP